MKRAQIYVGRRLLLRQEMFEGEVTVIEDRVDIDGEISPKGSHVLVQTDRGRQILAVPAALHEIGVERCSYCGVIAPGEVHLSTARTANGSDLERFERVHRPR